MIYEQKKIMAMLKPSKYLLNAGFKHQCRKYVKSAGGCGKKNMRAAYNSRNEVV